MKILFKYLIVCFLLASELYSAKLILSQVGYLAQLPKFVYYTANADSFFVIEKSSGTIFYRSAFEFITNSDPATGLMIYRGNFSSFSREGVYFIKTSTNDTSYEFTISGNVINDPFRKSLKAFYYQRCGTSLLSGQAGVYSRSPCHTTDAIFHLSTGQPGYNQSTRGWHDAGDYGKYVVNAGISVGTLLMGYEQFPSGFNIDDLNIPETGNSIPDILDEVKFEIDWLLKMQNPNGGIYFKLTPQQFEPFVMPAQATATRYIYQLSTTATGNFIAVLSRFARLYKPFDSTFSTQCLNAATMAWNYLTAQQGIVPPGGYHNPPGTVTGEYGDGDDSDERLWAAAELFETTGLSEYKDYFDFNYNLNGILNSTMSWGNVRTIAQITYLMSKQPTADGSVKNNIQAALTSYCNELLNRRNSNVFGVSINPGEYNWGSNSSVLNNAIILIYGYEKSGNSNYRNAAFDQLNYILGVNGNSYSYLTGVGKKRVLHPHHRPSEADGIAEPIPGLMVGGPDEFLDDPVLQQHFTTSTPPALCYIDDVGSYASNEVAINWNAPLVFVTGFFNSLTITSIKEETRTKIPTEFGLEQNYPNPFNPSTIINFSLAIDATVTLKVYDLLGQEIHSFINNDMKAGYHSYKFDASKLRSGIYLYQLNAKGINGVKFTDTKKMILTK